MIALFVPLLVPGLAQHKLFASSGAGDGPGARQISLPNPLVQMNTQLHRSDATDVLSYQTSDPDPQYLQVYVLSNLNTQTWTLAPTPGQSLHDGKLPATPGLTRGTPTNAERTTITLAKGLSGSQRTASFLPMPYPARTVNVDGDWRVNPRTLTVFSGQDLSGLQYSVGSREVTPAAQELEHDAGPTPTSITNNYLSVPKVFRGLTTLAEKITRGQTSSYNQAVALQHWFTSSGKFTYSLDVQEPASPQALIRFLTTQRRGYCQQFAFAMAVLARLLGIPSRVAVGYTAGTPVGHDRWVVKTSDAHAWPELYFQGAGWLRFEPTPAGSGGQATAIAPNYSLPPILAPSAGGAATVPTPGTTAPQLGSSKARTGPLAKLGEVPGEVGVGGTVSSRSLAPYWLLSLAALAVLALVTPRTVRSVRRRWRWRGAAGDRDRAEAAWSELVDDLTDYQVAWSPSASPRALARQVSADRPMARAQDDALTRIAQAAERARYAPEPADSASLRADTEQVRRALAGRASRRVRWQARLLPRSALRPLRTGLQHALDVFGWMDVAAHRISGVVRRADSASSASGGLYPPTSLVARRSFLATRSSVQSAAPPSARRDLLAAFLAAAPALFEPLHEPGPWTSRGPGSPGPPVPPVPGRAAPDRATGHVPPTGQRPHRAGQHDHEASYADHGELGHDTGQQQADAEQEPDRRLDDPALVVHPGILRAHCLRELWILSIERTLDLLELTLLVLRQRHGASHETLRAGTGAMTSSHGPGSSRIRAWPLWVEG